MKWPWLILLLFPAAALAQPPLVTHYAQTDEIRRVICFSTDYALASLQGAAPRIFLVAGVDAACPGPLPAECTFGADQLVDGEQLGLCPGTTSGPNKCLEVTFGPACSSPAAPNCRDGNTYQYHRGVNTAGASPDRLDCDFRMVIKDTRATR